MSVRSLVFVLALALFSGRPAFAQSDADYAAVDAFFSWGYTYCDAEHVASAWQKGQAWDAKITLGRLVQKNKAKKLDKAMLAGRTWADQNQSTCEFYSSYAYEDAEAIGQLWGMDTWDAKVRMSSMLRSGDWAGVDAAMYESGRYGYDDKYEGGYYDNGYVAPPYVPDGQDPLGAAAAFAGFNTCDFALLAAFWGLDEAATYHRVGELLSSGGRVPVEHDLSSARMAPSDAVKDQCSYFGSAFTYDDAELLAQRWGIDVYDAKVRIGEGLIKGQEAVLRGELYVLRGY